MIKESETYPNGSVTNEIFTDLLKKYLPNKSATDILELVNAAEKEQPNEEQIALAKLFSVVKLDGKDLSKKILFFRMMKIIMENLYEF